MKKKLNPFGFLCILYSSINEMTIIPKKFNFLIIKNHYILLSVHCMPLFATSSFPKSPLGCKHHLTTTQSVWSWINWEENFLLLFLLWIFEWRNNSHGLSFLFFPEFTVLCLGTMHLSLNIRKEGTVSEVNELSLLWKTCKVVWKACTASKFQQGYISVVLVFPTFAKESSKQRRCE